MASVKWKKETALLELIKKKTSEGMPARKIADYINEKTGRSFNLNQIEGVIDRYGYYKFRPNKAAIKDKELKEKLSNAEKIQEKIVDAFRSAAKRLPAPKPPKARKSKKHDPEDCVCLLSDTQIGQKTLFAETHGISEYSFEIFQKRVKRHIDGIAKINDIHASVVPVNTLWVLLMGDMGEGETVFKGQLAHVEMDAVEQIVKGSAEVAKMINELCGMFPEVKVLSVPGNHGRIGRPGDAQGNLDNIFYHMLRLQLQNNNLSFIMSESNACVVEIRNHMFAIAHGDNIRGWMGMPFYGAERATRRLADITDTRLDYALYAHHHQIANIPVGFTRVIFNGAYPGGSDFSVNKLVSAGYPMQKLFYVHDNIGITSESNINLEPGIRGIQVAPTGPVLTPARYI